MNSLLIISILAIGLIAYMLFEYQRHQRYLKMIPTRIHINGTRGKSSVTRLIGAGLRVGGYRTITKVTGTFPRMILSDGTEVAIYRKEKANILEQLEIIKFCSQEKADVMIIECMALQPTFQKITEHQMVKATIGVITNIRLDHLDVMGPTLDDVAESLCYTVPKNSKLFTSEDRYIDYMKNIAKKNNTEIFQSKAESISDADIKEFSYIEHKDNVALALDICKELGVDEKLALQEMKRVVPDEGVLRKYTVFENNNRINFFNALAANDPESSLIIWKAIKTQCDSDEHIMVLLNTRKDRQDRAVRLVELIGKLDCDSVALIGETVEMVVEMCLKEGVPRKKIHAIGMLPTKEQYIKIGECAVAKTSILALGNMGAGGAELAQLFEHTHFETKN